MCKRHRPWSRRQGADGGTRTHMGLRPRSCEDPASTDCATPAPVRQLTSMATQDAARQETVSLAGRSVVERIRSYVVELLRRGSKKTLILWALIAVASSAQAQVANRGVYLDKQGVVRWRDTKQEVALFGANYVLPTASDYRAAGYLHADRKKMIDEDMAQFARMGWDGRDSRSGATGRPPTRPAT